MANNLSTLLKSSSGQLYSTSPEELATLSAKAGAAAPVLSPLAASLVGGNPNQAKMAGTGAQKAPALREAAAGIAPADTLSRKLATTGPRSQATAAEQQAQAKTQGLSGLGSLTTRVDEIKKRMLEQAVATAAPAPVTQVTIKAGVPADLATAIKALAANPADQQAWLAANYILQRGPGTELTGPELLDQYVDKAATNEQNSALAVHEPTMADLSTDDLKSLGYDSLAQVSQLLGQDVSKMSFTDFHAQLERQIHEEMSQTAQLSARAHDPDLGLAEQAEAHSLLRDASAVGTRASEQDAQKLADQVDQALTVTFNGQEMGLEQALSSSNVSQFIQDYLAADPQLRATMAQREPSLSTFVEQHEALLGDLQTKLTTGASQFADTQVKNKAMSELAPGLAVRDSVMQKVFSGWGELSSTSFNFKKVAPLLLDLKNQPSIPLEKKQDIVALLDAVEKSGNDVFLKNLVTIPLSKLTKLGLASSSDPRYQELINTTIPRYQALSQAVNTPVPDKDYIARALGYDGAAGLTTAFKEARLMDASGLFGQNQGVALIKQLTGGSDKLDWDKLQAAMKAKLPYKNITQLVDKGWQAPFDLSSKIQDYTHQATDSQPYQLIHQYLGDGRVTQSEAQQLTETKGLDELQSLYDSPAWHTLTDKSQALVIDKAKAAADIQVVNPTIAAVFGQRLQSVDALRQEAGRPPSSPAAKEAFITELQDTINVLTEKAQANQRTFASQRLSETTVDLAHLLSAYQHTYQNVQAFNPDVPATQAPVASAAETAEALASTAHAAREEQLAAPQPPAPPNWSPEEWASYSPEDKNRVWQNLSNPLDSINGIGGA